MVIFNLPTSFIHKKTAHLLLKQMRNPSEAIISNIFFTKKIEYRYEEVIKINGKIIVPDFRILVKSENRIKILEHFGMRAAY